MALILAYPYKVTQLETDYEFFFKEMENAFKKDILRQSIPWKDEANICPLTNEINNYRTFSSSETLNQINNDITRNAFLKSIRNYFIKMLQQHETPTSNGYIAFVQEKIENALSIEKKNVKLKF
tara:strand:- start:41 stop:412 length:372 start_codon:yes stop_codon:yes gene_type:complete